MSQNATVDYVKVRTALLSRGHSLRSWAMANSLSVGSVYNAVKGLRGGKKSVHIRQQLQGFINDGSIGAIAIRNGEVGKRAGTAPGKTVARAVSSVRRPDGRRAAGSSSIATGKRRVALS